MHAIKLKAMIDQTHRLQIDLPADTPEGEAEVIVLVSTPNTPNPDETQAEAPMHSLLAFLHDLDSRPLAHRENSLAEGSDASLTTASIP